MRSLRRREKITFTLAWRSAHVPAVFYYGKRRNRRKNTEPNSPTAKRMRPIIRFLAHSQSMAFCRLRVRMGEKSKSAAPRLKSVSGKSVARGNVCRERETCAAVRFRFHSFTRSVADLDFSPNANERLHDAQDREWAKNRIIGHGFRAGGAVGWPVPSSSVPFCRFRSRNTT